MKKGVEKLAAICASASRTCICRTRARPSTPRASRRWSWTICWKWPRRRPSPRRSARESRGAHARDDYQERDDENWLCHSMFDPGTKQLGKRAVNFKPRTVDTFEPKVADLLGSGGLRR
ncbi:MAG: hypothetical protein U5R48_06335 [Gammaproteobacteria bacterium]|nr:hypothetical protein [Gammaproteobacteria bacterium]